MKRYKVRSLNLSDGGGSPPTGGGTPVPSIVQRVVSTSNIQAYNNELGNNFAYSFCHPVQAGNTLIVCATWEQNRTLSSISDNINGTWPSPIITENAGSGNTYSCIAAFFNAAAGVTKITVALSGTVYYFQFNLFEICNVVSAGGSVGAINITAPSLACGSFTPTNNNANGGNFILSYFCNSTGLSNGAPSIWTQGAGQTLIEGDITMVVGGFPHATQSIVQATAAAINPSMTATGDTTDTFNCLAVALQVGASGGPKPSTGIHIDGVHHFTPAVSSPSTVKFQIPCTGNLRVLAYMDAAINVASMRDSDGNSYSSISTGSQGTSNCWWAENTTPNEAETLTVTYGSGGLSAGMTHIFYDISNANASQPDNSVYVTTQSWGTTVTNHPSITPNVSVGLCIGGIALGQGPGETVTSPSGAVFTMVRYTGQTDNSSMDNSDCEATFLFSSNATINFSWTVTNATSGDGWAVTFK